MIVEKGVAKHGAPECENFPTFSRTLPARLVRLRREATPILRGSYMCKEVSPMETRPHLQALSCEKCLPCAGPLPDHLFFARRITYCSL